MFGAWARAKHWFGGGSKPPTVASAATVYVPDHAGGVLFTGAETITTLNAAVSTRGSRLVYFYSTNGSVVLTNTDDTTTAGKMDLGGSNITLGATDMVVLYLRSDGVWIRATDECNN